MSTELSPVADGGDDSPEVSDPQISPELLPSLRRVIDPELRRPILELGMVESAFLTDGKASARILLTVAGCPAADRIVSDVRTALESVTGPGRAIIDVDVMSPQQRERLTTRLRRGRPAGSAFGPQSLTTVVAVASGKGGVGKSTIAVNLAVELAARGLEVGIVDADVHGFSVPRQLGLEEAHPTRIDDMIVPPVAYGVKAISIGMFLGSDQPIAWRGPILHRTLSQFLTDVWFGDIDVLVVDLPPGTGDIALTAGQMLPTAHVIVVTTPQSAASEVAIRAGQLALRLGQSVLGVVENMSWFDVDGQRLELFGHGGGHDVATRLTADLRERHQEEDSRGDADDSPASPAAPPSVPVLAQVPFDEAMRTGADEGTPIVQAHPDSAAAAAMRTIADCVVRIPRVRPHAMLPLHVSSSAD